MPAGHYSQAPIKSSHALCALRGAAPLLLFAASWLGPFSPPLIAQDEVPVVESSAQAPAQHPQVLPTSHLQRTEQDYIVSPDDDLEINVMDVAELSRQYRVSPTGMIDIPLLPMPISAVGQTPEQLARVIAEQLQLAGMVDHPHVTVRVKESRLHSVAIAGAVKRPQIYQIFGKTTVLDALSQAEGLSSEAGKTAIITRGELGQRMAGPESARDIKTGGPSPNSNTVTVDLKRLMEDGDSNQNIDLYPGDRLSVQRAGIVYVMGAVKRSGGFVINNDREQMTVLKAIALADNITPVAAAKKTVIIRGGAKMGSVNQEIPIDLDKILKHRAEDRVLLANDILLVPESGSKKAMIRSVDAAAQAAVLLVYRIPY